MEAATIKHNQLVEHDRSPNIMDTDHSAITDHGTSVTNYNRNSAMFNWMWPPNSMSFHDFNFKAFDAQFQRGSQHQARSLLMPAIPIVNSKIPYQQSTVANSPTYTLSVIL